MIDPSLLSGSFWKAPSQGEEKDEAEKAPEEENVFHHNYVDHGLKTVRVNWMELERVFTNLATCCGVSFRPYTNAR